MDRPVKQRTSDSRPPQGGGAKATAAIGISLAATLGAFSLFPNRDPTPPIPPSQPGVTSEEPKLPKADLPPFESRQQVEITSLKPTTEEKGGVEQRMQELSRKRDLGLEKFNSGNFEEGLLLMKEALAEAREVIGEPPTKELIPFINPLARSNAKVDQFEDAVRLFAEKRDLIRGDGAQPDKGALTESLSELASALRMRGFNFEAQAALDEAIKLGVADAGLETESVRAAMARAGVADHARHLRGFLKLALDTHGPGSQEAFKATVDLAENLERTGNRDEAEKLYREALANSPRNGRFTFREEDIRARLARLLVEGGKVSEAGEHTALIRGLAEVRLSDNPQALYDRLNSLTAPLLRNGQALRAAGLMEAGLQALERAHGADSLNVALGAGKYAQTLLAAGQQELASVYQGRAGSFVANAHARALDCERDSKLEDAELLLSNALAVADDGFGRRSAQAIAAGERLRDFYARHNNLQKAQQIEERLRRKRA